MNKNTVSSKRVGAIDKFIGKKIKVKRLQFGMSQKRLSDLLQITFQQLQKYENGTNRTPLSRLYELSKVFNIPINYFFEGLEEFLNENNKLFSEELPFKQKDKSHKKLETEVLKLNRYFVQIKDDDTRKLLIKIMQKFERF